MWALGPISRQSNREVLDEPTSYERVVLRQMERDLAREFVLVDLCPRRWRWRRGLPWRRGLALSAVLTAMVLMAMVVGVPDRRAALWMGPALCTGALAAPALGWLGRRIERGAVGSAFARCSSRAYRRSSSGRRWWSHRSRKRS